MRGIRFAGRKRLGREPPLRNSFWVRRAVAAAIVTALVAVPLWTILINDDDGGSGDDALPELPADVRAKRLGIEVASPDGWKEFRPPDGLRLQSPDKSAQVVITSRPGKGHEREGIDAAVQAIERNYKRARVTPTPSKRIGGVRMNGGVVTATNKKGVPIKIFLLAGSGRKSTYVIQVLTAENLPPERLVEVEQINDSIRFTG